MVGDGEIKALSCGRGFTLLLARDGRVFSFGSGNRGRLGLGDEERRLAPQEVPGLRGVSAVCAGRWHAGAVAEGRCFTWGLGLTGGLGHGDGSTDALAPVAVEELAETQELELGGDLRVEGGQLRQFEASGAVDRAGAVRMWGADDYGLQGSGGAGEAARPRVLEGVRACPFGFLLPLPERELPELV